MLGIGTIVNVLAILIGGTLGALLGSRLPEKTGRTVTDGLGILTLVLGGLNLMSLSDAAYVKAVTPAGTFLVVVFAIAIGAVIGSLLDIESRLESFGGWLQKRLSRGETSFEARDRFISGFVNASLIMAVGPMAILGGMSDGMGNGADTLIIKSILDGFASIAFAASMGWGVAASAITVGIWQGAITIAAMLLGDFIPAAEIAAITATGGVLMLGIGLRILNVRAVSIANLLPALILAPLFTIAVRAILG